MFFDSFGHGFKDFVIIMFIIFTLILSIYIMVLNSRVHWWQNNCGAPKPQGSDNKGPDDFAVVLSSMFMGVIILTIMYAIYEYYTKGVIVGINKMGRY